MTVQKGIDLVRLLLDESGYEFIGVSTDTTTAIVQALQQAALQKAQEYWSRGDKEATLSLWTEQTVTGNPASLSFTPLHIETVRTQNHATDTSFKAVAKFVPHEQWGQRRFNNPSTLGVSTGRYEYTYYDDKIYHNGDATAGVKVSYLAQPAVSSTLSNQLPMAVWTHGPICERAAKILYEKEVQDDDRAINQYNAQKFRSPLSGLLDLEEVFDSMRQKN